MVKETNTSLHAELLQSATILEIALNFIPIVDQIIPGCVIITQRASFVGKPFLFPSQCGSGYLVKYLQKVTEKVGVDQTLGYPI